MSRPKKIEIAATDVQARLELAFSPGSAQKARFSCLNLVHSLESEDFLYRYNILVDVLDAAISDDPAESLLQAAAAARMP
ncbi:hypothetical protein [Bradyrhizobium zhanjiangense]|uniref:hypothetical protein n=1 Tax=Bradyrhizobium zhanjiangense TaxID=1325107 RepID=UPI001FDFC18E|nr:hypothetical protein [Bradyrhizobium zhanjiangense]